MSPMLERAARSVSRRWPMVGAAAAAAAMVSYVTVLD